LGDGKLGRWHHNWLEASMALQKKLPVFLTPVETAKVIRISPRTLEGMRLDNRGPKFTRLGNSHKSRLIYRLSDLEEWIAQCTHSTSETDKIDK
jgi:hypothetical protein